MGRERDRQTNQQRGMEGDKEEEDRQTNRERGRETDIECISILRML